MNTLLKQTIVVTGVGCVVPGAIGLDNFWTRLMAGNSAVTPYDDAYLSSDAVGYFGHVSAEHAALAAEAVPFKLRRYATPCAQWGIKAAADAMAQAGLDLSQIPEDRRGLFTAQGDYMFPSVASFMRGISVANEKKTLDLPALTNEFIHMRGVEPFVSIKSLANNVLAIASLAYQMRGDCGAYVQDDNVAEAALRGAMFSLRHGYSDVALLICSGSYNEALTLAELYKLEYLSACRDGASSLRPFDMHGDGTIAGEGAIALVLETAEHAQNRQAGRLARIGGSSSLVDVPGKSQRVDAYRRCAGQALAHANLDMADVDAIVASGKGAYRYDQREAALLTELQAGHAARPVTCATSITGYLPACPTQWLTAIGMLQHGQVPAIAHLQDPLDNRLRLVRDTPLEHSSRHVLALNAGFSGSHSAVIFSHA